MLLLLCAVCFATRDEDEGCDGYYYYIGSDGKRHHLKLRGDVYYDTAKNKPYNGKIIYAPDLCEEDSASPIFCSHYCYERAISGNMKDGKLHGESKIFYENGKLKCVSNYKDGKQQGESKGFYENGKLQCVSNYKDGKLHGERKEFYENGELDFVENYKDGKRQ